MWGVSPPAATPRKPAFGAAGQNADGRRKQAGHRNGIKSAASDQSRAAAPLHLGKAAKRWSTMTVVPADHSLSAIGSDTVSTTAALSTTVSLAATSASGAA